MAAPEGNQNNKKGKMFYDALRKVLVQEPKKLTDIAEGLIEVFTEGNLCFTEGF